METSALLEAAPVAPSVVEIVVDMKALAK